ncbi:DUF4219 domain-containing protein [Cephalotus follicularis]|uniref:DUF4219 domain-containing protein n=1 Tax=Cephalotus follicularis TaxID=3775 RepID=A0A1Q3C8C6_CEPFO|nr:DUF4219 domain-containing protein [Cephalotus follicularis]
MALCASPVSHILRSFDRSTTIQSSTSYKDVAIARDNYKNWSVCMKNYLLAQDLWNIIEASSERKAEDSESDIRNWRKKNAAALLAMQNSCEPNLIFEIGEITSAKDAWNALAKIYEPTTVDESGQPAAKVEEHQLPATNTNQQSKVQQLQALTLSQGDSSNLQPQRATANQGDVSDQGHNQLCTSEYKLWPQDEPCNVLQSHHIDF